MLGCMRLGNDWADVMRRRSRQEGRGQFGELMFPIHGGRRRVSDYGVAWVKFK